MANVPDPDERPRKAVPERFLVAKGTLRFDRFMTHAIRIGGVGIIVAVFGILVFILGQVLPLFTRASIEEFRSVATPGGPAEIVGIDEWSELPYAYSGGREVAFTDLVGDRGTFTLPVELPEDIEISALSSVPRTNRVVVGTRDGRVGWFTIDYKARFEGDGRVIEPSIEVGEFHELGGDPAPVIRVAYGETDEDKLFAALQEGGDGPRLKAITLVQKRSLIGAGKIVKDLEFDLTDQLSEKPTSLMVSRDARSILAVEASGSVDYFYLEGGEFALRQTFEPFADLADRTISLMEYVFGDVSAVLVSGSGAIRVFSLHRPEGEPDRIWGHTKTFPSLPGPANFFAASQRNKSFLVGAGREAILGYATTETVRLRRTFPFEVRAAAFDSRYETLGLTDPEGTLHLYHLHDPHPEAGWRAFFGKVWYEGGSEPVYKWQSTGGTDDFELKLSMIPLIVGSLKGTLYSMLFAVPVALLAAVYTAQFLHWKIKKVIKPTMEIMASLPSVVLGFLGALWLAPILETRVPSVLLVFLGLPATAALFGWAWNRLPVEQRSRIRPGYEFFVYFPILIVTMWACWNLGPVLEALVFTVTDPATGGRVADFRLWWPEVTGTPFEQRNSLVVGFMMGFAVIPIIFTIAEDSLSNVPPSLVAGASALGASRWQVVRTVVIPIASAGIFSALMIGFGRAVGETMIMVMATGNTPIMEWNIFSGMRTLAANIAVELPEAPRHSTHYRALFLGAVLLFAFTFVLNTIAEMLRYRLREKFKLI